MARVVFPKKFAEQKKLLRLIKAKHDADGANSVLTMFLVHKDIDLNADTAAANDAEMYETSQKQHTRQQEYYVQQRMLKSAPVFLRTRAQIQFLKAFYNPNTKQLGQWGVTVTNTNKILFPAKFIPRTALFKKVKAQHDSYPAGDSPLDKYLAEHNISLNDDAMSINQAETADSQHQAYSRESENFTQLMHNRWQPVAAHLHTITDYLKKLYKGKEKTLGEWGITVDDSPRKPRERISSVLPAGKITLNNILIEGTFTNTGDIPLLIHKGKNITNTGITVSPAETVEIPKGFSIITVTNPSQTIKGRFKVVRNK